MKADIRALSFAGAFTLMALTLTGCGAPQTNEQACQYLETEISSYVENRESPADDEPFATTLEKANDKLGTIGNGVSNAEVKGLFDEYVSALKAAGPTLAKMADDPSIEPSDESSALFQRAEGAIDELREVCPDALSGMAD